MFAVSTELRLQDASLIASTGPGMRSGRHRLRAQQRASSSWRSALHQLFLNFAQAWAYIYSFLATVPLTATKKVLASLKPRPVYVAMQLSRQNTFFFNVLVSARNDSQPLWSLWIACPALSAGLLRFRLFSFTPLSGTLW